MIDLSSLIIYFVTTVIGWFVYKTYIGPYYLSSLRNLPGPPSENPFYGNLMTFHKEEAGGPYLRWAQQYGSYFKYHGIFNRPVIVVTDPKPIQEILVTKGYEFGRCKELSGDFSRIIGAGLVQAEGHDHKKQRKMMNPAFTHKVIKNMVPTFVQVGLILKELISDKIDKGESKMVLGSYISETTLDIIGLVGFDSKFDTLTSPSELAKAYSTVIGKTSLISFTISILAGYVPFIRKIPIDMNKNFNYTCEVVERESQKLIEEKYKADKNNKLGESDLLSILIKLNKTLPVEEKMTDQELKYQIMTLLLAGHMTTSVSLSWALHMLAQHPHEQNLLRQELVKAFPDKSKFNPTFDEINSLEYLNCICKETFRLFPPVIAIQRTNTKDTFIGEHFVKKGSQIDIPIAALQRLPSVWGPTADDFDPKRWLDPSLTKHVTNYNYMPFNVGIRSCIGNKLALSEFKTLLSMLVRNFAFKPVEGLDIKRSAGFFTKPDPHLELIVSKVEA